MAVKSVIDVEVNDEEFRRFTELFDRYKKHLADMPKDWVEGGREILKTRHLFEQIGALLLAQNALTRHRAEEERKASDESRKGASHWHSIARSSREFAGNVAGAARSLLRVTEVGGFVGGLLGIGGLFGLDRLAGAVGTGRRTALGLGIPYGASQAFSVDYGRLVEPGGFLTGVSEALRDVTKRSSLYGAGLTEQDLAGKNTGQVAVELIGHLKAIADRTPTGLLAQQLQALGLGQFITLQDFQRLKATPAAEVASYGASFLRDRNALGLSPANQRIWQDFSVQMTRAGAEIENVFVRGLRPLIPGLTNLSSSFAKAVTTFLSNKHLSEWLTDFGKGIEAAARYVGSDEFQKTIKTVIDDVAAFGRAIEDFLGLFGKKPTTADGRPALDFSHGVGGFLSSFKERAYASGFKPINNPGNLRPPGKSTGFQQFPTLDAGVLALAKNLRAYETKHHLYTTAEIIGRYAPPGENDTKAYVADVLKRTGHKPGERWDFADKFQLAKFMAAIIRHENGKKGALTEPVILKILNETGANVVTSTNQVAK